MPWFFFDRLEIFMTAGIILFLSRLIGKVLLTEFLLPFPSRARSFSFDSFSLFLGDFYVLVLVGLIMVKESCGLASEK